jgi:hypothetical protein
MELVDRLNRLDRRVLGKPQRNTPAQNRRVYLVGLVGTTTSVVLALAVRSSLPLAGVGGFVGVMVGGGVRWYTSASTPVEERHMRPLFAAGAMTLLLLIGALATTGRWSENRFRDFTPGPYFQKAEPTMVVLCPETPRGEAYTYQAPASETPTCRNGAVPKVVVRG